MLLFKVGYDKEVNEYDMYDNVFVGFFFEFLICFSFWKKMINIVYSFIWLFFLVR